VQGHGYQQLICCFSAFVLTKNDEGKPIHGDWQNLITGDPVRQTFLMEDDDELGFRARIIDVLDDHEKNVANNPVLKNFKCLVSED
jgi:hypothetical protein